MRVILQDIRNVDRVRLVPLKNVVASVEPSDFDRFDGILKRNLGTIESLIPEAALPRPVEREGFIAGRLYCKHCSRSLIVNHPTADCKYLPHEIYEAEISVSTLLATQMKHILEAVVAEIREWKQLLSEEQKQKNLTREYQDGVTDFLVSLVKTIEEARDRVGYTS